MRVISPLLKHIVYPGLARTGYLRRTANSGPIVITYHGVIPPGYESIDPRLDGGLVTIESFQRQLGLLRQQYNIVSPRQFLDWRLGHGQLPERSVLLTCDDGLKNVIHMLPILRQNGAKCIFFVTGTSLANQTAVLWYDELYLLLLQFQKPLTLKLPTDEFVEIRDQDWKAIWWELVEYLSGVDEEARRQHLSDLRAQADVAPEWLRRFLDLPGRRERFSVLDQAGLQNLIRAGHTLGAHSLSHPLLSRTTDEMAWAEIAGSREILERATGQHIWAYAYPFGSPGSVSARDLRLAETAGFQCAFLNSEEELAGRWYAVPRVHVTKDMGLPEFEGHISVFHSRLRYAIKQQLGT